MKYYKGSLGAVTCPCFFHEITGIKSLVQFLAQKVLSEDLEPMMTIPSPLVLLFSSSFNAIANCLFSLVNKAFQRYPLVFYYGQSIPMLLLCFLLQTKMTLLLLLMIHASIARDLLVRMWRGACF